MELSRRAEIRTFVSRTSFTRWDTSSKGPECVSSRIERPGGAVSALFAGPSARLDIPGPLRKNDGVRRVFPPW